MTAPSQELARVHLILGPVGAGKSTYALALTRERRAVRFALDEWMARLFSADRPDDGVVEWYRERARRVVEQIWAVAKCLAERRVEVVLELGLIQRRERLRFYERVRGSGLDMTLHVLDATRDVRRERVQARNEARGETFSMVVPDHVFELASDLWEPVEEDECQPFRLRFRRT